MTELIRSKMNEETFLKEDLIALRKDLGLTQHEMAERLGMALRGYQDIEAGESKYRFIHRLAVERVALLMAVDKGDPQLAPSSVRDDAIGLVQLGQLSGNPAYLGGKEATSRVVETAQDEQFRAAYGIVGELVLIATALDYQLNHVLIQVLHLTDSPMLESVIATLDTVRKIEMLKARSKHIHEPKWRKTILSYLDKLERVSRWRNIACHTVLVPDDKHGAVFVPAAAAKFLKSLQISEDPTSNRFPVAELKSSITLAESTLYDGENILHNFRKVNTERVKRFGK
jgi:DNA-binding XRE family transcriptional regulator